MHTRRKFLLRAAASAAAASTAAASAAAASAAAWAPLSRAAHAARTARTRQDENDLFEISLAQWSLHRSLRSGELDHLDFARTAREELDIHAVEYVNTFFKDKATDFAYLAEMQQRAADVGVRSLLIMIDGEGALAAPDAAARRKAIENHFRWLAAAAFLGCHSIRVNAGGSTDWEQGMALAADSLQRLAEIAEPYGLNVIVENHGGLSSDGKWLAGVMQRADHPRVGTLPDFGNFDLGGGESYDRYLGVEELMPWAKAVSAKSHAFDAEGNELRTDYARMLGIVKDAGYRGFIGVEFEGQGVPELEGIRLTRDLLRRVRKSITR